MLTCKIGIKKYNIFDLSKEEYKKLSKKKVLKCPLCEEILIYKHGQIKIKHFSHMDTCKEDKGYWENETKLHALGKIYLYKWLKKIKHIKNLELEKWLPETKQKPDLYFEFLGKKYVIEFQCSNLTLEQIRERRFLYSSLHITDIWIFGVGETCSFNFEKQKAIDEYILSENKSIFYLDVENKTFIKKKNKSIYINKLINAENFYIDRNGIIYLQEEIDKKFNSMKNKYIKDINLKIKENRDDLLAQQRNLYFKISEEIEIERNNKRKKTVNMELELSKNKHVEYRHPTEEYPILKYNLDRNRRKY